MLLVAWSVPATSALAQSAGNGVADEMDRSMEFVEKTVQATDLYNQGKLAEALAAFDALLRDYASFDEDGYVATSVGDCLAVLGRHAEAVQAYAQAMSAHPGLTQSLLQKLREVQLLSGVDDTLIAELREDFATAQGDRAAVAWQLGRALQKRAESLLAEAVQVFHVVGDEVESAQPQARAINNHAAMLTELHEDLSSLIQRLEGNWSALGRLGEMVDCGGRDTSDSRTEAFKGEWVIRTLSQALRVTAGGEDAAGDLQFTLEGRPIQLNRTQALLIRRHQERINAILLEAANAPAEPPSASAR